MKPVMCEGNHYFDSDKYSVCPVCGKKQANQSKDVSLSTFSKRFEGKKHNAKTEGIFGDKINKEESVKSEEYTRPVEPANDVPAPTPQPQDEAKGGALKGKSRSKWLSDKLQSIKDKHSEASSTASQQPVRSQASEPVRQDVPPANQPTPVAPATAATGSDPIAPINEATTEITSAVSSLKSELDKVTNDNQGKTVGIFSAKQFDGENAPIDPVVGWLVAIKGPHKGQSFEIVSGKNSIGRRNDNRIVLANDNEVSRENHAWIIYEPKKRDFYLKSGDERGLVYVNDDVIMETLKLKAKDKIELGSSLLLLVPFCSDEFSWDELD